MPRLNLEEEYMPLLTFDPPGMLEDFGSEQRKAWHDFISAELDAAQAGNTAEPFDSPRPQFFNSAKVEIGQDAATEDIKWTAFPRIIEITSGSDQERWERADASRDVQDEYCEWSVTRQSGSGKILRIAFTCEGPEYWNFLAATDPARTLELYRQHINPNVKHDDLYGGDDRYIARNRWNNSTTQGAMHLVQQNNTLHAEIEISGAASITRLRSDGSPMTDTQELIRCGRYGAPQRHSDPFIGARVNFHARAKADVTLANPVGIYFAGLDTQEWDTPDGADPRTFWHYTRGAQDRPVRAVLEVPADKSYTLGDVTIDGRRIAFGGQVADRIQMTIRAVATRTGQSTVQPVQGCVGDAVGAAAMSADAADLSVAAAIAPRSRAGRL